MIKWDLNKDRFPSDVKEVLICNSCGWLIQTPREIDIICDNCSVPYLQSNSKPIKLKRD